MTATDFTPLMVKAFKFALVNDTAILTNISQVFKVEAKTWEGRRLQFLETASLRQLTGSDAVQVNYNVTVLLPTGVDSESAANATTDVIEQLQSDLLSSTSTTTDDGESSFVKTFKIVLQTYDVAVNVSINENATTSGIEQLSENVVVNEVVYTRPPTQTPTPLPTGIPTGVPTPIPTPLPTPIPGSGSDDDWAKSAEGIAVLVVVPFVFVVLVGAAIYKKDVLKKALRSFRDPKKGNQVAASMSGAQGPSGEGAQQELTSVNPGNV